ncbi:MAG: exosortase E/protease, VPEID-CTERM system [Pseudomonadota bacterium]
MTDLSLQTSGTTYPAQTRRGRWRLATGAAVLVVELLVLYALYHPANFVFECRGYASPIFCGFLSAGVMRAAAVVGALVLYLLARPRTAQVLTGHSPGAGPGWAALHLLGFGLILAPLAVVTEGISTALFTGAAIAWLAGGMAFVLGGAFFVAPPAAWMAAARSAGPMLALLLVAALALPDIAPWIRDQVQFLWHLNIVTEATFWSVAAVLEFFGEQVFADVDEPWFLPYPGPYLGIGNFIVGVGRQCSGTEGFALITGFTLLYIALFRNRLRLGRVWILLPIGLALSWCLNVVRIAILIWIGAYVSPELAIEGFHSHAGWLMFTLLAISLATAAHQVVWFRRDETAPAGAEAVAAQTPATPRAPRPDFFADPVVAQILPFMVFMATALLASTFFQVPAVTYPLRALAMAGVLVLVWRALAQLDWRVDLLAVGAGLSIGVLWLATSPIAGEADTALNTALAAMPAWLFMVWALSRILGTAVLVPVIEELFFRGYIMSRLDQGGLLWRVLALGVSAGLFAVLHDRWLAAALSGLIFGLLYLRRGRLADAIYAHAAANAVIAGWAVWHGDWSVI